METFTHKVTVHELTGSHFDVGQKLGARAKETYGSNYVNEALASLKDTFLYKALGMKFELTPEYVEEVFPIAERAIAKVHSGLLEEMKGFAKGLGESYPRFLVFVNNYGNDRGCSQFFVNGYHARNYDDNPKSVENEFLLLHSKGSNTTFGATTGYVERLDGINEKGLAVSLTFGAGYPPKEHGIGATLYSRIVLDKAANVAEALEIFQEVPYITPNNVLLSDANGDAAIIETSAGMHQIRKSHEGILYCANSYLHPDMRTQQKIHNPTTKWREGKIEEEKANLSTEDGIMNFLTTDFPNGLFEPYFKDGLGTIWSVIYRPETRGIHLAVGEKGAGRKDLRFNLANPKTFQGLPITLVTQLKDIDLKTRIPQY